MLSVIVTSSITILLLGGYRLLWRRRYGARRIDGFFVRVQGRIAGPEGEVVLRRSEGGEILRSRGLELELEDQQRRTIDLRSPWLILIGRTARRGQLVTVDGLPTSLPRSEALYREAAVEPALEALRVAPGAWPELPLLHLPLALALLLLITALAFPTLVQLPERAGVEVARAEPEPEPRIDCPAGTRVRRGTIERWCETPAGVRQGPSIDNWTPTQVREQGSYRDGEQDGAWVRFDWQGRKVQEGRYDRGRRTGCWRQWQEGTLTLHRCFQDDRDHGAYAEWNPKGQLLLRGSNHEGEKHGLWQSWSSEGILELEGSYRSGKRHGPWRTWNRDGGRASRGDYLDGKHEGLWRFWHETGQLAGRGRYRQSLKEGRWSAFYPSGRLAAVASYRRGKRTAFQTWREDEWLAQAEGE